ncbi:MAG: peptidylprolyl isomerase [Paucibacter sp.]|nr:peptidylprolyl isomerase [Roseateles sp.]
MTDFLRRIRALPGFLFLILACTLQPAGAQRPGPIVSTGKSALQPGDFIAAVVNQDIVAGSEVIQRMAQLRQQMLAQHEPIPDDETLREKALDLMIDDRAVLTFARENGNKVDEAEIDRYVASIAAQNKLTMPQLLEQLKGDGMDLKRFRDNVRDQIMTERVRDGEVRSRIHISDADVDAWLDQRRSALAGGAELDIAQILVTVPDDAAQNVVEERRERAQKALDRVLAGEDFATVNKEVSEDGNKANGGDIGLRPIDRLPDVFVAGVKGAKEGEVVPHLVRSGGGFHVLKLIKRSGARALNEVLETHARHILLQPSTQLSMEAAAKRLAEFKQQIVSGEATFEELARKYSVDGSAAKGGDLGWSRAGMLVPEFEQAMNALPIDGISDPVPSRYGVHLIQVLERRTTTVDIKQLRAQARDALTEQKYDAAYQDWLKELRARAYIEKREWPDDQQ